MNDTIIFNWPSGAGGDFIMSLVHLAKKSGVYPVMHYPNNKYNANDEFQDNVIRTFGMVEPIDLSGKEHGYLIYTHCLFEYANNLPDNIIVINIDNSSNKFFTDLLLVLKSRKSEIYEHRIFSTEMASDYSDMMAGHDKFYNFKYEDILSTTVNNLELERLFSIFDIQLNPDIMECIYLYAKINEIMVNRTSILSLENLRDHDAYAPSYNLGSINHLRMVLNDKLQELKN